MKKSKILRAIRKELFKVENLEQRILLSADPVFGAMPEAFVPDNNPQRQTLDFFEQQVLSSSAKQIPLENVSLKKDTSKLLALDVATIAKNRTALDGDLVISQNEILKGSGSLDLNVINKGVLAPGNSPGLQSFSNFTQEADGALLIELGGNKVGETYDQLNISGIANLGGRLSVSLLDNFQPKIGDTFDILKFGSVQGSFDSAQGLYGFNSDYYFDLVQTPTSLQLVVKEFSVGNGFELLGYDISKNDQLGQLFNYDYFTKTPQTVELDGTLDLGESLNLSGRISFGLQNANTNYTLSDNSKVSAETWALSARNAEGFIGINGDKFSNDAKGLLFNDVNLGLAFINPVDNTDERSWIIADGSMGGFSFNALPELDVSASNLTLDLSEGHSYSI